MKDRFTKMSAGIIKNSPQTRIKYKKKCARERRNYGTVTINTPDWTGKVGFVPSVLEAAAPASADSVAIVCGPPVMIKFTFPVLEKLGFADENIYTTLENRMKCGVGKCGRCNVGKLYVCKDGPVFTKAQLNDIPPEY